MEEKQTRLKELVDIQEAIRTISVIAHIDHGKTTMSDCLIKKAGISNKERYIDSVREDQTERIITIKSTGISLAFKVGEQNTPTNEKHDLVLSLVDSPGHAQFSDQVSAAIRLTDGALLVVDAVSGVAVQTETVLKQALEERVKLVLLLNKLDRCFLELKKNPEELYQDLFSTLERTNALIKQFTPQGVEPEILNPIKGNVVFGSGKQGWIFSLPQFAEFYSKGTSVDKMVKYLWGDYFYDTANKKWRNTPIYEGKKLERGFVKFVLQPIYKLCKLCTEPTEDFFNKILKVVTNFNPKEEKMKKIREASTLNQGKDLMQKVFSSVLPAAETILSMIYHHIPNPIQAQSYRASYLYTGPEDEVFKAIQSCDPKGPLTIFISKMTYHKKSFLAYGKVLSGTAREGCKVTVLSDKYKPNRIPQKGDIYKDITIKSIKLSLAKDFITIPHAVAGNIICIGGGMDAYVEKSATLTDFKAEVLYPIRPISFVVSPVVRVAVAPKSMSDLPKLKEGLQILGKTSAVAEISFDESDKKFIIEGAGELAIEVLLKDLQEFSKCELSISEPVVPFRETVTQLSEICLTKSPNKLNRIYCTAEPLSPELVKDIQEGKLNGISEDPKKLSKFLISEHKWNSNDAKKVWCFGPVGVNNPCNVLVDQTKASDYLNEIKDHLINAFHSVCRNGGLSGEPLIGVKFNIIEVKVHSDNVHRGAAQIIPAAKRLFEACHLLASPKLVEPIYLASIKLPADQIGNIYQFLGNKRTQFVAEDHDSSGQVSLQVHLPVLESFKFDSDLGSHSSGKAFPSLAFSHWSTMESDPFKEGSVSYDLIMKTRQRKGLKKEIPNGQLLVDKL